MIKCIKCGIQNDEHRIYCSFCNAELNHNSIASFIPKRESVATFGSSYGIGKFKPDIKCSVCNAENSDENSFCFQCGNRLK